MQRKRHTPDFKAKVALEALKGNKTINEIASEMGIHSTQITQWKKQAQEGLKEIFAERRGKAKNQEPLIDQLYQNIGRLQVELEWLKKNLALPLDSKRKLIEPSHSEISVVRQCELLGLNRSSYYYQPAGESDYNEYLMRKLDEQYTQTPFYGVLKMTELLRQQGELVNPKRVRRLLRKMGLEAIYPKPKLSRPSDNFRRYPYLLESKAIEHSNQVWSTDITYIRLQKGFIYLVAVIDWYSRYVLSWEVSNTLDVYFCLEALETALSQGTPEIFNTDQGSQFTSLAFTERLLKCVP